MNKGLEKFYELVEAFESLPTIGKKSALRLAYHIVMNDNYCGIKIAHSIENALKNSKLLKQGIVKGNWEKIVGKDLGRKTYVSEIRNGVLIIKTNQKKDQIILT